MKASRGLIPRKTIELEKMGDKGFSEADQLEMNRNGVLKLDCLLHLGYKQR
jgi:hypothetical protein